MVLEKRTWKWLLGVCAVLAVLIVSGISCKHNPVGPVVPDELWPLKPGNKWVYIISIPWWPGFSDTLRIEVTGYEVITYQQQTYQAVKVSYSYSDQPSDWQWLMWTGPDGIYRLGGISSTDTFVVKYLWLKYPAEVGDKWPVPTIAFSDSEGKLYLKDTLIYSLVSKDDTLETLAEKFKCYVYEYSKRPEDDVAEIWHYKHYFSPGVGLVGLIVKNEREKVKAQMLLWKYFVRS